MEESTLVAKRPRWQTFGMALVLVAALSLLIYIASISTTGFASQHSLENSNERRDCITNLSTARNAVFQDMDIYKAIQIDQLSTALLNSQTGTRPTQEEVAEFGANDKLLQVALVEARRVQPAAFLHEVINNGGTIAGIHYEACRKV